jgi:hypothetical protein
MNKRQLCKALGYKVPPASRRYRRRYVCFAKNQSTIIATLVSTMGKKSKRKSNAIQKQRKLMQQYQKKWDGHTLTRAELERFSSSDQIAYLNTIIEAQHPGGRIRTPGGLIPTIGGWYACLRCAKASVFQDGYVSEDGEEYRD